MLLLLQVGLRFLGDLLEAKGPPDCTGVTADIFQHTKTFLELSAIVMKSLNKMLFSGSVVIR